MTTSTERYQALLDMKELFFQLARDIDGVPEKVRSDLRYIHRHFPDTGEFDAITSNSERSANPLLQRPAAGDR